MVRAGPHEHRLLQFGIGPELDAHRGRADGRNAVRRGDGERFRFGILLALAQRARGGQRPGIDSAGQLGAGEIGHATIECQAGQPQERHGPDGHEHQDSAAPISQE
jgi:hypothetical protein